VVESNWGYNASRLLVVRDAVGRSQVGWAGHRSDRMSGVAAVASPDRCSDIFDYCCRHLSEAHVVEVNLGTDLATGRSLSLDPRDSDCELPLTLVLQTMDSVARLQQRQVNTVSRGCPASGLANCLPHVLPARAMTLLGSKPGTFDASGRRFGPPRVLWRLSLVVLDDMRWLEGTCACA